MKKLKHKKAFTIVELVIVIAVIAILSAILIPTFSDLIKKARESSDKQLVRNLNVAMAISEETDFSNMNNTLGLIFEESKINVSSIKASSGEILFDSKTNRFLLLNTSGDVIFWDTTKAKPNVNEKSYLYWKICDSSSLLDQKYSIYWNSEQQFPLNEIYVGFDCGANTLPVNLTYKNLTTEAKEITIRTNGGNLTIDGYADELGNGDEIHHYGFSDSVNIIKVANSSYHEYGKSIETTISFGHFVAEKDSYTALLNVENTVAVSPTINSSATVVVASNKSVNLIENKSNSEIYYATENQQTVNECEHNYIEIEDSNYKICTICGNILDTTHEHNYLDEYIVTETHHSKTCTICGHADSHEHHSVKINGTQATCTETGLTDGYYCDICEYIITEQQVISALGHSASDWIVTLEPTCTAKGSRHKICTVCNVELENEEINALGHDYNSVVTNPTCTEQGFTTHTCSRCGDSYIDTYVDANGHSYPDEYTKTETHHSKTCTICGHTDSHEHHSVKIDGTPATSTETGLTDGFYCDICGYVITEQEEIPVLEDVVTALYNLLNTANTSEESDIIIEIDKDYDLNNEAWTPINLTDTTKTITINGNNKTISNINASGTFAGLFGEVSCTLTINNLTINGGEINANVDNGSAGTFVGKHTSGTLTLSYCNVNNITVYGKKFAGGVIGTAAKATISHCTINNMNIRINKNSSNGGAGGVVGQTTTDKKVTIDRLSGSSNNLSGVNLGRFVGNNKGTCQVTNSSGFVTDPNTNTKGTGNTIT